MVLVINELIVYIQNKSMCMMHNYTVQNVSTRERVRSLTCFCYRSFLGFYSSGNTLILNFLTLQCFGLQNETLLIHSITVYLINSERDADTLQVDIKFSTLLSEV